MCFKNIFNILTSRQHIRSLLNLKTNTEKNNYNKKYLKKDLIRKKIKSYRNFKNTKQSKKNLSMKPEEENRNLN